MNKLLFPVPPALRPWASARNTIDGTFYSMFEDDGGTPATITNFVLWAAPDEYRPVTQNIGDDKIIRGMSRTVISQSEKIIGFDYDTEDGRPTAYQFLQLLAREAAVNTAVYKAVTVIDYCLPEIEDIAIGYTIRSMKFASPIQPKTGLGGGYTGGFSFSMVEVEARYRY